MSLLPAAIPTQNCNSRQLGQRLFRFESAATGKTGKLLCSTIAMRL